MKFVQLWQDACIKNVAHSHAHNTMFDIYFSIFFATFDTMFRIIGQPKSAYREYAHWRQFTKNAAYSIKHPHNAIDHLETAHAERLKHYAHCRDTTHFYLGKFCLSLIAAICAGFIIILFAVTFLIFLPILLILWLISTTLHL